MVAVGIGVRWTSGISRVLGLVIYDWVAFGLLRSEEMLKLVGVMRLVLSLIASGLRKWSRPFNIAVIDSR